jgi:hypothetical protein
METMSVTLGAFAENAFEFEHEASGIPTDSLFRSAFKAAVVLAGHGNDVQSLAERLGEDFGQSYQVNILYAYTVLLKLRIPLSCHV